MKLLKKKILVVFMACLVLALTSSIPVLAATNSFSSAIRLTTDKKTSFSLRGLSGGDIQVSQLKIYFNISSGTGEKFSVYLESPSGTVVKLMPLAYSGTYYINSFNGEDPKGTWYAWIEMEDNALIKNMIVNASVTVTYSR